MIPAFPDFARVTPEYLADITKITKRLPEYSDYNPASLFAWDIYEDTLISDLDGNLVVIFTDYIDGTQFISLHGVRKVTSCIPKVFKYAQQNSLTPKLRLIPEETAKKIRKSGNYHVYPDRDNYDYIVSLDNYSALSGKAFANARWQVNSFEKNFSSNAFFVSLDLNDSSHVVEILDVFEARESMKPFNNDHMEFEAIKRLVTHRRLFDLAVRGIRIDGVLQAFIIIEETSDQLVGHFWKANTSFSGIYHYLLLMCCKEFSAQGYEFMNMEQDLGLHELRSAKRLMRGTYLKKYSIEQAPMPLPTARRQAPLQLSLKLQNL